MLKVHSYESMGTYDGPGLRLVVFLQGCQFRCLYCANPDTISLNEGKATDNEEIVRKVISQKPFFGKKGGITFSGGEPLIQARDLIPLFKELKKEEIHICLDTNGGLWSPEVEELFKLTDLVLFDIKQMNVERHKLLTGRTNYQTLKTAQWLEDNQKPMWLRYVLIPGYTDLEEDIRAVGQHFQNYKMIERVEILPYHKLGVHKYETLGLDYKLKDISQNTPEQLDRAKALFDEYFKSVVMN